MNDEAKVEVSGKMAEFIDWVGTLTVLELSKLVKALEEALGVTAAAPMAVAAAPAAGAAAAPVEEQTEFDAVLTEVGGNKIAVAKDLVDGAPKPIKSGVSKDEAAKIKEQVEKAGAKVEIK